MHFCCIYNGRRKIFLLRNFVGIILVVEKV
jgi:hypothetical protein